jgi:hypothetical protein
LLDRVVGPDARVEQLVFYFAGHGETRGNQNVLVSRLGSAGEEPAVLELQTVLEVLTNRANRVVMMIDACRDRSQSFSSEAYTSPFDGAEFYILFSTRHKTQALDGLRSAGGEIARGNSPFARAVLKYLPVRSLSLSQFRNAVGDETRRLTNDAQIPEAYDGIGPVHLDPNYRPWHATP